jgi:hypothetical protein
MPENPHIWMADTLRFTIAVNNKPGNLRSNVTLRRVYITIVALENQ